MLATHDQTELATRTVVLALPDAALAAETAELLGEAGWRVARVAGCAELRRLCCRRMPDAVVLPADGPDESGWLTCAKLLRAAPRLRVVLVGEPTAVNRRLARFIGATAVVPADVSAAELADRME